MALLTVIYAITFIVFIAFASTFFTVDQQTTAVVERFGKFLKITYPGLNTKIPFIDKIVGRMSMKITQLDVKVETKTRDDVFVEIIASVQFKIIPNKAYDAFYTLDDTNKQIKSFVFDVIRSRVPKISLDEVFSKKDEIADSVKEELKDIMFNFGYDIIKTLVTDIHPNAKVKAAMNEINEAHRLRIAAMERGEAEKILKVKQAEAESESKILQGQGIAGQRRAIIDGLKESVHDFHSDIPGSSTQEVITLILIGQYFDTLKDMASHGKMNSILIPHSPSSSTDLANQIRDALISANEIKGK